MKLPPLEVLGMASAAAAEPTCALCRQGPSDLEKDLDDDSTHVHWEKKGKDSQGLGFDEDLLAFLW